MQAYAGALVVRHGYRPLLFRGATLYFLGLVLLSTAQGKIGLILGAGVFMGLAMSCTVSAMANSVASRAVPAHLCSITLGIVTAAGSIGALISAPIGQGLIEGFDWRIGAGGFVAMARCMIPAACRGPRSAQGVLSQAAEHGGASLVEIVAQPLEEAAAPVRQWMG